MPDVSVPVSALRDLQRWTTWTLKPGPNGKPRKVPAISTRHPERATAYHVVNNVERTSERGVGLVLTGRVPVGPGYLIALDVDSCFGAGNALESWAERLVAHFDTYTELSPSGTGLRLLLVVKNPPSSMPKIRIPADGLPPKPKLREIQVFGCGPSGYVTFTGQPYGHNRERIAVHEDLSWLGEHFDTGHPLHDDLRLPTADSDATPDSVLSSLRQTYPELTAGDWAAAGVPSASEGWFQLVTAALSAARQDGPTAVDALLQTAYGLGDVDSLDPDRYAKRSWVTRDVARIAAKHSMRTGVSNVFTPLPSDPDGQTPNGQVPQTPALFLQAGEFVRRVQRTTYLLHDYLPAQGVAQFFGAPGTGKTAVVLSLAISVAAGRDWGGRALDRPGSVFYIAGEGLSGLSKRLRAQLAMIDPLLPLDDLPLHLSTRPGSFTRAEDRAKWTQAIREIAASSTAPALIVLDTQSRNFGPGSENDTADMSAFVREIDAAVRELSVLVVLVHHSGHKEKGRGRGSSVLTGALDAIYEVVPAGTGFAKVIARKAKDWALPTEVVGKLEVAALGVDEHSRPVTAITFTPQIANDDPFDPIEPDVTLEPAQTPVQVDDTEAVATQLEHGEQTRAQLQQATGLGEWAVRRVLSGLVADGRVVNGSAPGRPAVYRLT